MAQSIVATNAQETITMIVSSIDSHYNDVIYRRLSTPKVVIFTEKYGFQDFTNVVKLPFLQGYFSTVNIN